MRNRLLTLTWGILLLVVAAFAQSSSESNDFSYALKLFNEKFYDIAAQQFSYFINKYPNSSQLPEARYYLAESLYRSGDVENARIEYQALAVGFPDHPRAPEAWYMVGVCNQELGRYEDAIKAFETVKILYPKHARAPQALVRAAELAIQHAELARARRILMEFLDRYVESAVYPRGKYLHGWLLLEENKFDQAVAVLEEARQLTQAGELKAQILLKLGIAYNRLGMQQKAQKTYQQLLEDYAGTAAAFQGLLHLVAYYRSQKDYRQGAALIRKYQTHFPKINQKQQLQVILARLLYLQKDFFNARKILRDLNAQKLDSALWFPVKLYTGLVEEALNAPEAAISAYEALIHRAGDGGNRVYQLGAALRIAALYRDSQQLQALQQLRTQFNRPEELAVRDSLYRIYLQGILKGKNTLQMRHELNQYLQSFPSSPYRDDYLFRTAKRLFELGDYNTGKQLFQQFIQEFPASEYSNESKQLYRIITRHLVINQQVGVVDLARIIGESLVGENRAQLLYRLGTVYLSNLKQYDLAAQVFKQALQLHPDSALAGKIHFRLAETLISQWELAQFVGTLTPPSDSLILHQLKTAMLFVHHIPFKDTLTFWFIDWSTRLQTRRTVAEVQKFWQHFLTTYPSSPLKWQALLRLANLAIARQDTTLAFQHLDKIIQSTAPLDVAWQAFELKAQLLAARQQVDLAINLLKEFLLNYPPCEATATMFDQIARWNAQLGNYLLAAEFLKQLIEQYPYNRLALSAKSQVVRYYVLAGEVEKARRFINTALAQEIAVTDPLLANILPQVPAAFYFYDAQIAFQEKNISHARQQFYAFLARAKDSSLINLAHFYLGKIAIQQADPSAAVFHLRLVTPSDNAIYFQAKQLLADILFDDGKYAEAEKEYAELVTLTTNVAEKIRFDAQRLRCLINQEKWKLFTTRVKTFRNSYKKHPRLSGYLAQFELDQGKIYYRKKEFKRALKHFQQITRKYKKTPYVDDALYYMGLVYTVQNRTDDALKVLTEIIKSYPNTELLGNVYNTLGNVYLRADKIDLAMQSFKKAVEVAQEPGARKSAMSNLITLYKRVGLWDSALEMTRRYIQEFPNATDLMDKRIFLGICLINLNRYQEAIDYFKKLKLEARSEVEPEIQFYIGEAYFNAGQYEDAIREFVKIPLLSRKTKLQWEASALYYAGQAYEKLGRIDDAIRMYEEIVRRPGILIDLKREARRRIQQLQNTH